MTCKNCFGKGDIISFNMLLINLFKLIEKKPIIPNKKEINLNPASRSAKLRYGIKLNNCPLSSWKKPTVNNKNINSLTPQGHAIPLQDNIVSLNVNTKRK